MFGGGTSIMKRSREAWQWTESEGVWGSRNVSRVGGGDLSAELRGSHEKDLSIKDVVSFSANMHFVGTLPVAILPHK